MRVVMWRRHGCIFIVERWDLRRARAIWPSHRIRSFLLRIFVRGMVLKTYLQWDAAEASLSRALELEPASPLVAVELARLRLDRNDVEGVQEVLSDIDADGMSHPYYVLLMGELALKERNLDEAFDRALWVLQNEPDNDEAIALLANVKFARSRFKALPFRLTLWIDRRPVWVEMGAGCGWCADVCLWSDGRGRPVCRTGYRSCVSLCRGCSPCLRCAAIR